MIISRGRFPILNIEAKSEHAKIEFALIKRNYIKLCF